MGRPPGARNSRGANGCSGGSNGGRKMLIANGRRVPGGKSSSSLTNGAHAKMNGNSGSGNGLRHDERDSLGPDFVLSENPVDFSNQVQFPYEVRLNGFSTLLETVKKSTESVRSFVMDECDIIMECRICRNLFRSLPNYLNHKESYCTEKYQKMSPAGLTQLMKLAKDSFLVSGAKDSLVKCSETETAGDDGENILHTVNGGAGPGDQDSSSNSGTSSLSFDLNHVIPMMTRATKGSSNGSEPISETSSTQSQYEAKPEELRLLDDTTSHQGYSRQRRVDIQNYANSIHLGNSARRMMHDTVLLGPDGKIACAADPDVIKDLVDTILAQVEESNLEREKQRALNCPECQTWHETEKALRMHVRTHAKSPQTKIKKRKTASPSTLAALKIFTRTLPTPNKRKAETTPEFKIAPTPSKSHSAKASSSSSLSPKPSSSSFIPGIQSPARKLRLEIPLVAQGDEGFTALKFHSNPTMGRRTNNSFNATLSTGSSPVTPLLPSLTPVPVPVPSTSSSSNSESTETKKVVLQQPRKLPVPVPAPVTPQIALTETRGRPRKTPYKAWTTKRNIEGESERNGIESSKLFSCVKCESSFPNKSQMSMHLARCAGAINFSLSTSHGFGATPKISILDRQEYYKPPNGNENGNISSPKTLSKTAAVHKTTVAETNPIPRTPMVLIELCDQTDKNHTNAASPVTIPTSRSGPSTKEKEGSLTVTTKDSSVKEEDKIESEEAPVVSAADDEYRKVTPDVTATATSTSNTDGAIDLVLVSPSNTPSPSLKNETEMDWSTPS